jgi:predicted ester cyclase
MPLSHGDLVRNFFEIIWNQRRIELIEDYIVADSVLHADHGDVVGPEEFKREQYIPFTTAFPDLYVELPGLIERGNEVVVRWIGFGTHTGDGLGFAPTGKKVTFRGISWIEERNGKFGRGWQSSNIEDVIRSLIPKG